MGIFSSLFPALFSADTYTPAVEVKDQQNNDSRPPIVEFYRYLRFRNVFTGEIDSNSGITFKICLDYDTGLIEFIGEVCRFDNFSKKGGREYIDYLNHTGMRKWSQIEMNYNHSTGRYEIDPDEGTVGMIINYLSDYNNTKFSKEDMLYRQAILTNIQNYKQPVVT